MTAGEIGCGIQGPRALVSLGSGRHSHGAPGFTEGGAKC
jgi:hypothetical protein